MSPNYVYSFQKGDGKNKKLLGGKGANLCEMTQIGLNVPPGFVISTEACLAYLASPTGELPEGLMEDVREHIKALEKATGKGFGDPDNPLLVSVRSGSALSMPGMMDTILNLGLNSHTAEGLAKQTGNERFALDAKRRFIQLFAKVAMGIPDDEFDRVLDAVKVQHGARTDVDLTADALRDICELFGQVVAEHRLQAFPEDVWEQLTTAIQAVLIHGWANVRRLPAAVQNHAELAKAPQSILCAMVFGNMGDDSAQAWPSPATRQPAKTVCYGEYPGQRPGRGRGRGNTNAQATQVSELRKVMPDCIVTQSRITQQAGNATTRKFKTLSLPLKRACCTCSRPATAR